MNIKMNELLLLDRKIKLGEEPSNLTTNTTTKPETATAQAGMNALMFQGMKNLMEDPQLATETKAMREVSPEQTTENKPATEYVAPYQTNMAFQGKAGKMKQVAAAALGSLAIIGASSTLTSCDEMPDVHNEAVANANVDISALLEIFTELKAMWQQMVEQQQMTNEQLQANNKLMQDLIKLFQDKATTDSEFQMFILANMDAITNLLIQQGMTQDEINAKLDAIINSDKSVQEKMNEIINLLGSIDGKLSSIIERMDKQAEAQAKLQATVEEIKVQTEISNELKQELINNQKIAIAQNDSLITLNNEYIAKLEQARLENNAGLDKIAKTINCSTAQLIAWMNRLGYTQAQIEKMTTAQIIAAIKENTNETKTVNDQLKAIYEELVSGKIDAKEAADKIIRLLGEIKDTLTGLADSFNAFFNQYRQNQKAYFGYMKESIKNDKFQTAVLLDMNKTQKEMAKDVKNIRYTVKELLAIAKDDTKHKELLDAIENAQNGGSTSIDYQKFEQMFKLLNMNLTEVLTMTKDELVDAINKNGDKIVAEEEKQTAQLGEINEKLDYLKNFNGIDKQTLVELFAGVTDAINSGNTYLGMSLDAIKAELEKIMAGIDAIYKQIGLQAEKVNAYYAKFDAKFDAALKDFDNIETKLAMIIANQKSAEAYLKSIDTEVKNLKLELQKLQGQLGNDGESITLAELEALWKERDAENFEKYSKLIKDLGIELDKDNDTVVALLASIDNKVGSDKDYTAQLGRIIELLENNPNYKEDLDEIKKLLEEFECNCQCPGNGSNNEGIIDNLEDLLK